MSIVRPSTSMEESAMAVMEPDNSNSGFGVPVASGSGVTVGDGSGVGDGVWVALSGSV